jgi:response regulator NasT
MTRTIILVDPNAERRGRIAHSVSETGFQISRTATEPEEAIRLAATLVPAVAIVAATLGLHGSLQLTDRLSTEHGIPSVLVAEAVPDVPPAAMAAEPGVMGVLAEPFGPATMRATLEVAVRRFQELRALRQEAEVLRQSLQARKVIERAKGLLMEVGRLSEREAYARIRRKSMDMQRPMTEIARAIIVSAEMSLKAG